MDSAHEKNVERVPMNISSNLFGESPSITSSFHETDEKNNNVPSNESLLSIAFCTFMGFTICQTVAAVIADSEAMMGDSAAMFVDALTYLFNWIAERRKQQFDETYMSSIHDHPAVARRKRKRAKRKMTLQLELIPPCISVSTLVAVTAVVLHKAVKILVLDMNRDRSKQSKPNVKLMFAFSLVNLLLDLFNVFCFAKAKHALGYETYSEPIVHDRHEKKSPRKSRGDRNYIHLHGNDHMTCQELETTSAINGEAHVEEQPIIQQVQCGPLSLPVQNGDVEEESDLPLISQPKHQMKNTLERNSDSAIIIDTSFDEDEEDEHEEANLNMCSAYTHVFADTLRSIAVVIASIVAECVDKVTPEEADATAAVVVSGLILLSLIPLLHGLVQTYSELEAIHAEEAGEDLFPGAEPTLYRMTVTMDDNGKKTKQTAKQDERNNKIIFV